MQSLRPPKRIVTFLSLFTLTALGTARAQVTAVDDTGSTDEDTVLSMVDPAGAETSLLANDDGTSLNVIASSSSSAQGASVAVAPDGTFSYDPSGSATLQALADGAGPVVDTFSYTIAEGSVPVTTAGADFNADATLDTNGNGRWDETTGISGFDLLPDNSPAVTRVTGVSALPGIDAAFDLPGGSINNEGGLLLTIAGTSTQRSFQEAPGDWTNNEDVSIEIWFKPDNLTPTPTNGQILFEDGGGTGFGFFVDNNELRLRKAGGGGNVSFNISAIAGEFIQAVGTYDTSAGVMELFVNGASAGTDNPGGNDWSGGDAAGVGTRGDANVGGIGGGQQNTETFDGQIAIFRVYRNQILSPAEVMNNFDAVTTAVVTDSATVSIDVTGVNDPPTADDATYIVSEDGPALINQAMTGSDIDMPDTLTFSTTTSPAMGMLTDNGNGTFTFDPNGAFESLAAGESAVVTFDFQAQDLVGAIDTGTVTIVVVGSNDDPTPMPDGGTTDEDTLLTVLAAGGLLSNDGDTDGDAVGVQSIDTTGTVGTAVADLMGLKLGSGLSGDFFDFNGPNANSIGGNDTGNQSALLLPLPNPGEFVLKRLGMTPSATVITPRVDFGTGTNVTQGDGSVLNRGGFGSGAIPPWQGLFNDVGETADMDGDQIAATWCGKIQITTAGDYTFTTRSDDGTVLYIDGVEVVDNNNFQGMTNRSGTVTGLTAGMHDIAIGGYEGGGGAGMQASYDGPDTTGRVIIPPSVLFNDVATPGTFVSGGLRGDYYDTNNSGTTGLPFNFNVDEFLFFGAPPEIDVAIQALFPTAVGVRSPRIDFGNDTRLVPGDGSDPERGSIQGNIYGGIGVTLDQDQVGGVWTGSLFVPETADFRIWQRVDDGGIVLIDVDGNGSVHDAGDFSIGQGQADGTITGLSAGAHKIVIASREGGGNHRMVVSWQQLTGTNPFAREVIPPANLLLPGTGMVGDGSYTYDPDGSFESLNVGDSAITTFTYDAVDPFGNTTTETVTITITGVNDPPEVTTPIPDQTIFTSNPTLDVPLFPHFQDVDNDDDELTYTVTINTNGALIQTEAVSSADGILTLNTPCTLIGAAEITVEVADPFGLSVSDTFAVEVEDDVPPEVITPGLVKVLAPAGQTSRVVDFTVTGLDKVDGANVAVSCTPPSGSVFGWGSTVVSCTATDQSGNVGNGSFIVTVKLPADVMLESVSVGDAADGAGAVGDGTYNQINGVHLTANRQLLVAADVDLNHGLWSGDVTGLGLVGMGPITTPPGAVDPLLAFDRFAIGENGDSAFRARLDGAPGGADAGHWVSSGGALSEVAVLGGAVPDVPAATFFKLPIKGWALNNVGEYFYLGQMDKADAGINEANNQGIFSNLGGLLVREGSPAPAIGGGATYTSFENQIGANDAGQIAFSSALRLGPVISGFDNRAVFCGDPASPSVVARRGSIAPATAEEFDVFWDVGLNAAGDCAFLARLRGGAVTPENNTGIWSDGGGGLALVAREGDTAPGFDEASTVFDSFSKVQITNGGRVVFQANVRNGTVPLSAREDDGIYLYQPGLGLTLVAREGGVGPGTAGTFNALTALSVHPGGELGFNGVLRRGTGGVTRRTEHGVWVLDFAEGGSPVPALLIRAGDPIEVDGEEETVHRAFVTGGEDGGTAGRSSGVACGNVAVVVNYDQNRASTVFVMGVPDADAPE